MNSLHSAVNMNWSKHCFSKRTFCCPRVRYAARASPWRLRPRLVFKVSLFQFILVVCNSQLLCHLRKSVKHILREEGKRHTNSANQTVISTEQKTRYRWNVWLHMKPVMDRNTWFNFVLLAVCLHNILTHMFWSMFKLIETIEVIVDELLNNVALVVHAHSHKCMNTRREREVDLSRHADSHSLE